MYRQLDMRIPQNERKSFGFAHRLYLYSDYNDGKEEDKNTCRR
ncbi:protein kinase [Orobanche hederae]